MFEHDGVTRREALIGAVSGLALAAFESQRAGAQAAPAAQVSGQVAGVVFEDKDRSGMASAANPGLAGALVSNGRDVAVTGADGRYTLPLPEEATIFVIKPKGFMPPVEPATNLPRFYRHHQPKGSPGELNLRFEGLKPTGPLPASVDFALRRQDESQAFNAVMVADPQPETGGRSRLHPRGPDRGALRRRRFLRPHRRRHHVRRSLALSALERDHGLDRASVVEHRRQPRPQFRRA